MPLVLKVCGGTWENESRDKRELSTYRDCGADVAVLAKGNRDDKGRIEMVNGFQVYRYSTRPLGSKVPAPINRFVSLFAWARFVKKIDPDVISGHDLMPGLTIAWMATWFNKKKPKLIYDSHEFELGRNTKRSGVQLFCVKHLERFLMKRCAFSIMVNDSIADAVQRIHKLEQRPIVVRSTPEKWTVDQAEVQRVREELLKRFANQNVRFLLMFHGNLQIGNGLDLVVPTLQRCEDIGVVLLGSQVNKAFANEIKEDAFKCGVDDRLLFLPPVDIKDLWKYSGAADIEIMVIEPIVKSHYYVLPNKLFESIQSETPIIASDLPEMRKIVEQYKVGLTCQSGDINAFCACISKMRTDKEFYETCKENTMKAKEELCWEKEKQVLKMAYLHLLEN